MEQKLADGLGEGQTAQLIEVQEVETGDRVGGALLPFDMGFGIALVHQVDDIKPISLQNLCLPVRADLMLWYFEEVRE